MWIALSILIAIILCSIGCLAYSYYYQDGVVDTFDYSADTTLMTVWYVTRRRTSRWKVQYQGSLTVWYYYPSFKRCSIPVECELSELYTKWEYSNKFVNLP